MICAESFTDLILLFFMYIYCLTFQITAASTIEVGVVLVLGGALYKWWNRYPLNPILPIAQYRAPGAPDASNTPVASNASNAPMAPDASNGPVPSQETDELLSVVVTDPIEQVETFLVLEFSKVPSMVFQLLFLAAD